MLAPLNSTMIAVGLPSITKEFAINIDISAWLVTAYLITMASLQPVCGRLGDRFGRRWMILGGLTWFAAASLCAALSAGFYTLIFFRVQQAVAGAVAVPNGAALVREIVPAERRAGRFGLIAAAMSIAAAGGPPLGGILVELFGWRAIFLVNLLFIGPALLIGWISVPTGQRQQGTPSFDVAGALLLTVVLVGSTGIFMGNLQIDTVFIILLCIALSGIGVYFLWREYHHNDPILQPRLFRHPVFAAANLINSLGNLAMYSVLLAFPLLLSTKDGWTDSRIGLVLTSFFAANIIVAPLGGRLADRFGRRRPVVFGLALFAAGLLVLALTTEEFVVPAMAAGLGIAGTGLGLSLAGLQASAVESVPLDEAGVAFGVFMTSRYVGSIVGSGVLAKVLASGGDKAQGAQGFTAIFFMSTAAVFASLLVSFALQDRPAPRVTR